MSKPYRLTCRTKKDIPSFAAIRSLVTREQHLVLQFPVVRRSFIFDKLCAISKRRLINSLARELPEYSVFDSGGRIGASEHVTIKAVVSKDLVLAHADVLVAARQFRASSHELISLLAQKLGVPDEAFGDERFRFGLPQDQESGELTDSWHYSFHGFECRFRNKDTKQVLDVILGFPNEWGVLDPYFFHEFLKTTPEFEEIAVLLEDGYHDTARALDILEKQGLLRLVADRSGKRRGLAA